MKKAEKIVCLCISFLLLVLLASGYRTEKEIDKNPVYVKVKIYAMHDTENGPAYDFNYSYNSIEYKSYAKTFSVHMKDSIIIPRISKIQSETLGSDR